MNDNLGMDDSRIAVLTDPSLGPMFWRPSRLGVDSAWYGHVPFAHWLVSTLRPASIVELGAHNGVSYSAFCEAVLREQLDARCLAIDTWQGDKHAGFYGDEVLAELQRFHDSRYAGFSTLLRSTFDDALDKVADGSVDLLHIDGRHEYGDVSHDFNTWRCKVSPRGIVLFHDTNVREGDFGVWRLWEELRRQFPSFEFMHGHGLGVLAVGGKASGALATLCQLHDGRDINAVRERFSLLGERWIVARDLHERKRAFDAISADMLATREWADKAQDHVNKLFPANVALTEGMRSARLTLATLRHDLAARERELAALQDELAERGKALDAGAALVESLRQRDAAWQARCAALEGHAAHLGAAARGAINALLTDRELILSSSSWRVTAPLRALRGGGAEHSAREIDLPEPMKLPALPEVPGERPSPRDQIDDDKRPRMLFVSGEDYSPGNVYRVEHYVQVAQSLGYNARWMPAEPIGPADLVGLRVLVIWRTTYSKHVHIFIDICRSQGTLVIFDVDDLMFRPELAVIRYIDGIRSQKFSEVHTQAFFGLIADSMRDSDLVTCPTSELAREARGLGRPAYVLPNGFDWQTHAVARRARSEWAAQADDTLRIGYASGSRTHQRDFALIVPAIVQVLRDMQQARLVLFRDPQSGEGVVLAHEFPELDDLADRIEWRDMVKLRDLPTELARFTINLAPLEAGNPFCEAKSELKYFEAALAGVPTIASPTGPYRRAINHGVTGLLASTTAEWYDGMTRLLCDPALRAHMAQSAYHDALAYHGPDAQADAFTLMLAQAQGGADGAAAFERARYRDSLARVTPPHVPDSDVIWRTGRAGDADVTVIVPVYNYADYLVEALASVAAQTLQVVDLVIIDDASPDDSGDMALLWLKENGGRFNRASLLRHRANAGLGFARNSGFAAAETRFVLPLDADNRLHPQACSTLLTALAPSRAAFAYPVIRQFGQRDKLMGAQPYSILTLQPGNYIDAMALVRKSAWAAAGGYDHVRYGWEDYDFWCRLAERGHFGISQPEVLADYRVHRNSMLRTVTDKIANREQLIEEFNRRHPWLDLPN